MPLLDQFKQDIRENLLTNEEIVQKYLIDGDSYFFKDLKGNVDEEYGLKREISSSLGIFINDINLIGSAQMGFSLKPKNLFGDFDRDTIGKKPVKRKDYSDLDIAIISSKLFHNISYELLLFTNYYKQKWETNYFHPYYFIENDKKIPLCFKYFEFLGKGWLRPDMLPIGFEPYEGRLKGLIDKFQKKYKRKVRFAIYGNWESFGTYHFNNIELIRNRLKTEE